MIHPPPTIRAASVAIALLTTCAIGTGSLTLAYPAAIQLRKIEVDSKSGQVTLRWNSQDGKTYAIEATSDPELGWQQSVGAIPGDPRETTFSLLPQPGHYGAQTMLFRIRETDSSLEAKGETSGETLKAQENGSSVQTATKARTASTPPENKSLVLVQVGPEAVAGAKPPLRFNAALSDRASIR